MNFNIQNIDQQVSDILEAESQKTGLLLKSQEVIQKIQDLRTEKDNIHQELQKEKGWWDFHWRPGKYLELDLPTVQEHLESKNVEIIYAVKYVPEINPTEKCNNTAKDFIKRYLSKCRIRNEKELLKAVKGAIKLLNEKDMTKYFKSAFEYKISSMIMHNSNSEFDGLVYFGEISICASR